MRPFSVITFLFLTVVAMASANVPAQENSSQKIRIEKGTQLAVSNLYGRVMITAIPSTPDGSDQESVLKIISSSSVTADEVKIEKGPSGLKITVEPRNRKQRVDLDISLPERTRVSIETADGEVRVSGDLEEIKVKTDIGTIAVNVPVDDVRYDMTWTESRPRKLSDFELERVKEHSGGRFTIKGKYSGAADATGESSYNYEKRDGKDDEKDFEKKSEKRVSLEFTTGRGIVLINVPPGEVMPDLRERPLTVAAKAIIRSGDSLLTAAIRRASPKYFGEYERTLPPLRREPVFAANRLTVERPGASVKRALVNVTDINNRSVAGLKIADFEVTESGEKREILKVVPTSAPVNLVLLLDVSGSIENYVNFIRKAARAFVNTVDAKDRISIVTFNDDVKVLSGFSTDRTRLSESLDTFDAGGGTAYYDAIAYTLTDVLRPLKGERTAIVILSDGDDNRSFLPLTSLLGSIEESGALIYPLYVPTSLVARSSQDPATAVDPLRSVYMSTGVTSKANEEGEKLAAVSGGVYYPIRQLSQIPEAYNDIVLQLRSAYEITFRSGSITPDGAAPPRLRIRSIRNDTFVKIGSVSTQRTGQ